MKGVSEIFSFPLRSLVGQFSCVKHFGALPGARLNSLSVAWSKAENFNLAAFYQ